MSLNSNSVRHHSSFPIIPTVASFIGAQVTGALWCGPLFGKKWMKAMKEEKPNFEVHGGGPVATAAGVWLTSSLCFSTMVMFWDRNDSGKLSDFLCLAHTAWLGFSVPGHVFATIFSETHPTVSILGATYSLTAFTWMAISHWLF